MNISGGIKAHKTLWHINNTTRALKRWNKTYFDFCKLANLSLKGVERVLARRCSGKEHAKKH